jgi:hypothetical protein
VIEWTDIASARADQGKPTVERWHHKSLSGVETIAEDLQKGRLFDIISREGQKFGAYLPMPSVNKSFRAILAPCRHPAFSRKLIRSIVPHNVWENNICLIELPEISSPLRFSDESLCCVLETLFPRIPWGFRTNTFRQATNSDISQEMHR